MQGQELPNIATDLSSSTSRERTHELLQRLIQVECPVFEQRRQDRKQTTDTDVLSLIYSSAYGSNVTDPDGNRFVDLAAGFGALVLGHRHPSVEKALRDQ